MAGVEGEKCKDQREVGGAGGSVNVGLGPHSVNVGLPKRIWVFL